MIKNNKFSKVLLLIILPVVMLCTAGFYCSFSSFGASRANALSGNGGIVYVGNGSKFNMTNGSLGGGSATNGGGVYVASGGTFNLSGGEVVGNTATNVGNNIYNSGTFTMTGGTVGQSGSTTSGFGIYNTGTMNLYGGTVYDDIYSTVSFNTKMACDIGGTINLNDSATITVQDYAGTTPTYNISLSNTRSTGAIVTFLGNNTTEPDISKIIVSGYNSDYSLVIRKNSDGYFELALLFLELPSDWKTQVASSTYMTTTVTPEDLTKIQFVATVPSGYTQIGTLSTGLPVYQGTTATEIAFVGGKIYAPEDSSELFYNLKKLVTINFSTFNTQKVTTMYSMFYNCTNLTSLDLSGFNTQNVTNMGSMFEQCGSLTSLDLSGFNTQNGTNMYDMFNGCSSLTSLDVSGFNTQNVTSMGYMFVGCSSLTSLDLSGFDTQKVTIMYSMFSNCTSLTSLDLSGFNTQNVTNMNGMFQSCTSLTSLDLSGFNTQNVTGMGGMFYYCTSLTSLDVSGFNTQNVTNMSSMFRNCTGLTSLDVSGFNTQNVTDMSYLFYNCTSLTSLDLSGFNTQKVKDMRYMFSGCSSLTSLDLSSFNMSKVTSSTNMLYFGSTNKINILKTPYNNSSALTITTGSTLCNQDTGEIVTTVPANTTSSLTYTTITYFPSDWKTQVASSTYMTSPVTVSNIERIYFPKTLNSAYIKIGTLSSDIGVYKDAYNSTYIAFYSENKIFTPTNSTQLFYGLNVSQMSFENVVTTQTTNMTQMFANCTSMKILDLSTFNMENVSTVTNMLNFGTTGALGRILTPYGNKTAVAITASSTLYDTSTDLSATGVLANSTASKTLAKKVTVTFNPYNGSAVSPSSYTAYCGEIYSGTIPTTTRSGFTFRGWYTEPSGGSSIDSYILLGNTTFYAHWADSSGGGDAGGGTTDPEPTLPSGFERKHNASQLGDGTINVEDFTQNIDIFNSVESNTFSADEVRVFSIVSPASTAQMGPEYTVENTYANYGDYDYVRLSNDGSNYSFLDGQWILGFYSSTSNIGFDQWYDFDPMFFMKIAETLTNIEILDLRGLDTSLTTFSFRLPDSVQIVIVPEDGCLATFVSNQQVTFLFGNGESTTASGFGGSYSGETGKLTRSISNIISSYISSDELDLIEGFSIISPLCPEQFVDYEFAYEYYLIENDIYLCLVKTTDSYSNKFGNSVESNFLAIVSYTSPIFISLEFTTNGGFSYFRDNGVLMDIDFRGLSVFQTDNVVIETNLEVEFARNYLILPMNYDGGIITIIESAPMLNPDGTTHTFLSSGADDSTGGLEISKQRSMLSISAENVDLYIDDKKWFDPKKNKIQIKTQNDGEE